MRLAPKGVPTCRFAVADVTAAGLGADVVEWPLAGVVGEVADEAVGVLSELEAWIWAQRMPLIRLVDKIRMTPAASLSIGATNNMSSNSTLRALVHY